MPKDRSIAAVLAIALFAAPAWVQTPPRPVFSRSESPQAARPAETLSSPSAAERFWEVAQELARGGEVTGPQADQAIILLTAAKSLNSDLAGVEPLLLKLAMRQTQRDYSQQVVLWLQNYVDQGADRAIVADAIRYLLDRSNSREQRRALLEGLVGRIGNRNAAVDSELATSLGLLMIEGGDFNTAKAYFIKAYTSNRYNKLAFAKLAEIAPNEMGPAVYVEHLRLAMRENPLDLNGALNFAQYAERLQLYDVAAQSYQYCAELFRYLYPSEPLPPNIYLPWAISCYNTERGRPICLQIAENVRNMGQFDILVEAIAGRAAAKTGNMEEARRILRQAEQKARQLLQSGPEPTPAVQPDGTTATRQVNAKQLAWFYCFADPNANQAVDWANKSYRAEPDSPSASALLAYALSMSNELEWAKPLLASAEASQMADLVQAKIALSEGKKEVAGQMLRVAISKDAGSLAAERAKEMLRELGSQYVPPVDPGAVLSYLVERLGRTIAPQFVPPDKMLEVQFSIRGNEFLYGNELDSVVAIANKAAEPLVISQDGLFQGNIRISARVSGDIKREIPNLVSRMIRTELAIQPGRSLVHPVRLSTGELREILMTYPQAALNLQFTLYLDPAVTGSGSISNRLVDVKPVTITVTRPRVDISPSYVRDRFNSISSGQEGQKIRTGQLFTGLLKEQYAMAQHGTLYPFKYAPWLAELLRSSMVADSGLLLREGDNEWVVKVSTMANMMSMPIDQELAAVLARNLNHPRWPVRLITVYLLAKNSGTSFGKVLDWVAQYDANELVRSAAISLQSAPMTASTLQPVAPGQPRTDTMP